MQNIINLYQIQIQFQCWRNASVKACRSVTIINVLIHRDCHAPSAARPSRSLKPWERPAHNKWMAESTGLHQTMLINLDASVLIHSWLRERPLLHIPPCISRMRESLGKT